MRRCDQRARQQLTVAFVGYLGGANVRDRAQILPKNGVVDMTSSVEFDCSLTKQTRVGEDKCCAESSAGKMGAANEDEPT